MKLYYSPGACSLSPHIALREAGIAHELIKVDLDKHTLPDGSDFRTINPRGYVPVLVLDDGQLLTEGPAIVQYIADSASVAGLAPQAGTLARHRLQEWLAFVSSELHQSLGPLFNPRLHASSRDAIVKRLRGRLDWANTQLQGRTFVVGEDFSVADGYLFTVLSWLRPLSIDVGEWAALAAHSSRVASRPAVLAALRAEGLA